MLRRITSLISITLTAVMLCFTVTGCSGLEFSVTNNLGKSALEYNTDYLAELLEVSQEDAQEYASVLDEQGCGKLITNTSKVINGNGQYKVGDGKNKYVFVVENSVLSRIETTDGNLVKDLINNSTPTQEVTNETIQEITSNENNLSSQQNLPQEKTEASSIDDLFAEDNNETEQSSVEVTITTDWSVLTETADGRISSKPNGGLTNNTILYNLGGNSLLELHTKMSSVNPDFNVDLFDAIYASTVLEENWVAKNAGVSQELGAVAEQGYAILAMLIADKFDASHYTLANTYISTDGSNNIYLILTDGSKEYELTIMNGTDIQIYIDGVDYTSKIYNDEQIMKYGEIIYEMGLVSSTESLDENDYNDYENITGNDIPDGIKGTGTTSVSELSKIYTIDKSGFNTAVIEQKIEAFYDSEIVSIMQEEFDVFDGEYEHAVIKLADGSECTYFFSTDSGANVYDSTTTFETIWASWE